MLNGEENHTKIYESVTDNKQHICCQEKGQLPGDVEWKTVTVHEAIGIHDGDQVKKALAEQPVALAAALAAPPVALAAQPVDLADKVNEICELWEQQELCELCKLCKAALKDFSADGFSDKDLTRLKDLLCQTGLWCFSKEFALGDFRPNQDMSISFTLTVKEEGFASSMKPTVYSDGGVVPF